MGETLIPTGMLRWIMRPYDVPGYVDVRSAAPVLQQGFRNTFGAMVWVDVPTVSDATHD